MRRIVLLGPPASGKGTQAALLSRRFGIPATSTGAMLRRERQVGSAIGAEADSWTSRGLLFPDGLAMRVVLSWLDDGEGDFILDGFPRTLGQARSFHGELTLRSTPLDAAFLLDLPEDEIRARILSRLTCLGCGHTSTEDVSPSCPSCGETLSRRNDDTADALDRRMEQYREHTLPAVDFYRGEGCLRHVDAARGSDRIFEDLCRQISGDVA